MAWADRHVAALQRGKVVQFRPRGNSMTGRINDGQLVTVQPVAVEDVHCGDIVLCKVKGQQYLHLVKAIALPLVLIGNNKGKVNGWTRHVYGRVTKVEA